MSESELKQRLAALLAADALTTKAQTNPVVAVSGSMLLRILRKIRILKAMKTIELPFIPVSPDTAARFASLTEEQKRVIRMRVAIEIGRLSKSKSRAESATEFRAATAAIGNRARRKGLSLAELKRMVNASR